jgi:hypothetical protein
MTKEFTVSIPLTLSIEDIDDIMVNAVESGYSWYQGGRRRIDDTGWLVEMDCPDDPDTVEQFNLPYEKLALHIGLYLMDRRQLAFSDELAHNFDSNDADCVVQNAAFGELVYG